MAETLSLIDPTADIGSNTQISATTRIFGNVQIGDGVKIDDYCVIGQPTGNTGEPPLVIRKNAVIRSHTVIYEGSTFGPQLETGHHVIIRAGTRAGKNLRVGNHSDIEGHCVIGDYCRFHGYVHVGRGSRIGHFVWLFSLTTLTNDPLPPSDTELPVTIEDGVVACVNTTILPGTRLGKGAYLAAGAHVEGNIPAGAVVKGTGGEVKSHVSLLANFEHGIRHPWMNHFDRGYPSEARARLLTLRDEITNGRTTFLTKLST